MRYISFAMLSLGLLAGCSSTSDAWLDHQLTASTVSTEGSRSPSINGNRLVATHLAWAHLGVLPEEVESVRQLAGQGSEIQQIVYKTTGASAGENVLTIERSAGSASRMMRAPSADALQSEMRNALPGATMTIDPVIRSNSFGAYGVALGKSSDGEACLYAWQQIKTWPTDGKAYAASVRLRYCDKQRDTAELANLMQSLSAGGSSFTAAVRTSSEVAPKPRHAQAIRATNAAKPEKAPDPLQQKATQSNLAVPLPAG